ncbi:MAG: ATP-binding protein [Anaerolineae bacterium]|nr:ATP-binding protein [Anaerolineae bacterium]
MADLISHEAPAHQAKDLPLVLPAKLIGRDKLLGQVYTLLKQTKPVLLYGGSGIGKSAFAATLARAYCELPGGALWLDVNNSSLAELLARIGRAYNIAELARSDNPESLVGLAMATLTQHKPLVVLDGAPDVASTSEFIMRCADRVPVLVVTDSESEISGPWTSHLLGKLEPDAAETLFRQIASSADLTGLEELLAALDNVPLGITVAAGVIATLGVSARDFHQAMPARPGIPASFLALTAAYTKLGNAQQGLLLLLGASPRMGGTGELLSMVGGAPEAALHQVMTPLVQAHLVDKLTRYGITYYRLHPLTHAFATTWLKGRGRLENLQGAMRDAVVRYTEKHSAARNFDALAAEMDNIRAVAAAPTVPAGSADPSSRAGAEQISAALMQAGDFIGARGYVYELLALRKTTIASATAFPAHQIAMQQPLTFEPPPAPVVPAQPEVDEEGDEEDEPLIEDNGSVSDLEFEEAEAEKDEAEAPVSISSTLHAFTSSALESAESFEEDFVEEFDEGADEEEEEPAKVDARPVRPLAELMSDDDSIFDSEAFEGIEDDEFEESESLTSGGEIEELTPLPTDEIERTRLSLVKARQASDRKQQAELLSAIGQLQNQRGLSHEAIASHSEALTVYEDLNDNSGVLRTLELLTVLESQTENYEAAALHAARGARLARELDNEALERRMLILLGDTRLQVGEGGQAIQAFSDALDLARTAGDSRDVGEILLKLGFARLDAGEAREATDSFEEALTLFRTQSRRDKEGEALAALGMASAELERYAEAINFYNSALYIAREVRNRRDEMTQLSNLGFANAQVRDLGQAVLRYRQALHLAFELDDEEEIIDITIELARMFVESPKHIDIAAMLVDAGLSADASDRDLRRMKERIEAERPRIDPNVKIIPVSGTVRDYARNAYVLLDRA